MFSGESPRRLLKIELLTLGSRETSWSDRRLGGWSWKDLDGRVGVSGEGTYVPRLEGSDVP